MFCPCKLAYHPVPSAHTSAQHTLPITGYMVLLNQERCEGQVSSKDEGPSNQALMSTSVLRTNYLPDPRTLKSPVTDILCPVLCCAQL